MVVHLGITDVGGGLQMEEAKSWLSGRWLRIRTLQSVNTVSSTCEARGTWQSRALVPE